MKNAIELFKECAVAVDARYPTADAHERLRAAVGLVDLTMRGVTEAFNQQRWESQQMPAEKN